MWQEAGGEKARGAGKNELTGRGFCIKNLRSGKQQTVLSRVSFYHQKLKFLAGRVALHNLSSYALNSV
jgi:hypothetical protein